MPQDHVSDTVHRTVTDAIRRGLYPPGSRLPGERSLATQLGVSRTSLRIALDRIQSEGLLARSAQRGWFVPRPTLGEPPSTLLSFSEMARLRGLTPTAKVLDCSTRTGTLDEVEKLSVAPGAPVVTLTRLRGMDGTPVCVDVNTLALSVAAPILETDLTDTSLYELLSDVCGVTIQRSAYSVQAEGASSELATLLEITAGSPVLVGREVAYDTTGRPVLLGTNTYRGDAYRFHADLFRSLP